MPTCIAEAPAIRNSITSWQDVIPPQPIIGIFSFLYKSYTFFIAIGCGGIGSWEDVIEFFLAGASAVQIGTVLYREIEIIKEINEGVIQYLKKHQHQSINDIRGLAHQFKTQEVPDFD